MTLIHLISSIFMMTGTFIVLTNTSPLTFWLGLEFNTLMFIPLMMNKNNISSYESMMKYFIIQALSSTTYLIPNLFTYQLSPYYYPMLNSILPTIMIMALLTKMAAAPFHFWLPPLIPPLSWFTFILMITWQKIAPLNILSYLPLHNITLISIILSAILPPVMMINQNSMMLILTYASISHLSWLLMANLLNSPLTFIYLMMYATNLLPIYLLLSPSNTQYINQLNLIPNMYKIMLMYLTLSLSGFPPLLMFPIKVSLMFQFMLNNIPPYIILMLLLSSLMTTYAYMFMNFPHLLKTLYFFQTPQSSKTSLFLMMIPPILTLPILYMSV